MELEDLKPIALTLLLIAVVVGIGMVVLENLANTQRVSATHVNETITADTSTFVQLSDRPVLGIVLVRNATNGSAVPVINYTFDTWRGIQITDAIFNGRSVNVTYTFNNDTSVSTAIDNSSSAIAAIPNSWFATLIIIIIAVLILVLVIRSIGGAARR